MFDWHNIGFARIGRGFASRVDPIVKKHSGNGVKTLKLDFTDHYDAKASGYIDSWLRIAITEGIEELSLHIFSTNGVYNFPCPLLSDMSGRLEAPSGDELECLLSSCAALQRLELRKCSEITLLKLPVLLQQLSCLHVSQCWHLRTIKNEAPSISSFQFRGEKLKLLLGESLQLKNLDIDCFHGAVYYPREELPSSALNLESLTIYSTYEKGRKVNTTMAPSKFLHLKYLRISLCCTYDYLSLVSFLDATPSLETFVRKVYIPPERMERKSNFGDASPFRRMPGYRHGKLQRVEIARFYSAKSLVELTCHILENATSLQRLTLDSTGGHYTCDLTGPARCYSMCNHTDIPKAISAIRAYTEGIVPSTVELNVLKPCNRCYVR